MSDSCGQINAMTTATTQLSSLANNVSMSKGNISHMPQQPTMHQQIPHTATGAPLAQEFSALTLQSQNQYQSDANWGPTTMNAGPSTAAAAQVSHPFQRNLMHHQFGPSQPGAMQFHAPTPQMMNPHQHQQHVQQFQQMQMASIQQQQQQQMMISAQLEQFTQPQHITSPSTVTAHHPVVQQAVSPVPDRMSLAAITKPQAQLPETTDSSKSFLQHLRDQQESLDKSPLSVDEMQATSQQQLMGSANPHARMIDEFANSDKDKWKNSKFIAFYQRLNNGEIYFGDNDVVERDFSQLQAHDVLGLEDDATVDDFSNEWQQEWMETWRDNIELPEGYEDIQSDIQAKIRAQMDRFNNQANKPGFEEGIELYKQGLVAEASRIFEDVVQNDPNHVDAWMWLGRAYAQLDQDSDSNAALETCLSLDAYNLSALLMLGVAHTNSHDGLTANTYLYKWLQNHPDYALEVDTTPVEALIHRVENEGPSNELNTQLTQATIQMFRAATEVNPEDVDLHTVLGVLYHISRDLEYAIEAFTTAVKLDPENPELWNKLGASVANSRRNTDCLPYYQRAIALSPNFTRAKSNVAVCYYNVSNYELAYQHFLDVLDPQNTNQSHLWNMFRLSLAFSGHEEAADAARLQDIGLVRNILLQSHLAKNDSKTSTATTTSTSETS